jgi:hypothetical protein
MVHVGERGCPSPSITSLSIHRIRVPVVSPCGARRCGPPPGRTAEIVFLSTFPSDRIRIIDRAGRRACTSLLKQGAARFREAQWLDSNTARPQGPPRPVFGLCAAGQQLAHSGTPPSSRFVHIPEPLACCRPCRTFGARNPDRGTTWLVDDHRNHRRFQSFLPRSRSPLQMASTHTRAQGVTESLYELTQRTGRRVQSLTETKSPRTMHRHQTSHKLRALLSSSAS